MKFKNGKKLFHFIFKEKKEIRFHSSSLENWFDFLFFWTIHSTTRWAGVSGWPCIRPCAVSRANCFNERRITWPLHRSPPFPGEPWWDTKHVRPPRPPPPRTQSSTWNPPKRPVKRPWVAAKVPCSISGWISFTLIMCRMWPALPCDPLIRFSYD